MATHATSDRLVVGLYMGDSSHSSGLWRSWICMFRALGIDWIPLWDHSFLVEDVLHAVDIIHVPGGFGWSPPMSFGGKTGQENLRQAVRRGVHFTGTCYGAMVAMASGAEDGICRLGLIDGRTLPAEGFRFDGPVAIDYLGGSLGYRAAGQQTMHIYGPMFGEGTYEVFGRFSEQQPDPGGSGPDKPIRGLPAAITAEFGRGRVLVFTSHPEQPASLVYRDLIEQVSQGSLAGDIAVRQCSQVPLASQANARMLAQVFGNLPGTATRECPVSSLWAAQQIAYLATAKDLLASRLREERTQLERALCQATTPVLAMAREVIFLRLQQATEMVGRIEPNALWDDSATLSRIATCFVLEKIRCGCDLPQYFKGARLDYLLERCSELNGLAAAERAKQEKEIAGMILGIRVRFHLDPMLYSGIACGLHEQA
jgi:hypothetical protein